MMQSPFAPLIIYQSARRKILKITLLHKKRQRRNGEDFLRVVSINANPLRHIKKEISARKKNQLETNLFATIFLIFKKSKFQD